ncbi:unnamed protein product [Lampetra fluviatilis]
MERAPPPPQVYDNGNDAPSCREPSRSSPGRLKCRVPLGRLRCQAWAPPGVATSEVLVPRRQPHVSGALAFCTDGTREQIDASELMTVQTPWSPGFKRQGPAAQHSDGSGGGGSGGGSGSGNSGGIGCSGRDPGGMMGLVSPPNQNLNSQAVQASKKPTCQIKKYSVAGSTFRVASAESSGLEEE